MLLRPDKARFSAKMDADPLKAVLIREKMQRLGRILLVPPTTVLTSKTIPADDSRSEPKGQSPQTNPTLIDVLR